MYKCIIFITILAACLPLLWSCRQAEPLAPEEPVVTILSPSNGATLQSGDIKVRIYLQNFNMVPGTGQANKANEGHIIYYYDVVPSLKAGSPATSAPGTYALSTATSYTWPNVPPGQHTFTIQLVNNDNTPFLSPAAVRAKVTVK